MNAMWSMRTATDGVGVLAEDGSPEIDGVLGMAEVVLVAGSAAAFARKEDVPATSAVYFSCSRFSH